MLQHGPLEWKKNILYLPSFRPVQIFTYAKCETNEWQITPYYINVPPFLPPHVHSVNNNAIKKKDLNRGTEIVAWVCFRLSSYYVDHNSYSHSAIYGRNINPLIGADKIDVKEVTSRIPHGQHVVRPKWHFKTIRMADKTIEWLLTSFNKEERCLVSLVWCFRVEIR